MRRPAPSIDGRTLIERPPTQASSVVVRAVVLAVVVIAAGCAGPQRTAYWNGKAPAEPSTATRWLSNAAPAGWDATTDRITFNRREGSGRWNAYSAIRDGSDGRCVTCTMAAHASAGAGPNRGASDVSPDGRYVLATVEKAVHPGAAGNPFTDPGRGLYNDVWLVRADGTEGWPLTNLSIQTPSGVIWPRFDRTGTQLVWAQMHQGADLSHPLGQWSLHVAGLAWDGDTPVLRDDRPFDPEPGRFFEPYHFSPDNRRIIFASDLNTPSVFLGPSATNLQIWTIDAATFGDLQRVSPADQLSGPFANYNEFAYYLPGANGTTVMFARTAGASAHGMDIWTANADGTNPRRVTFFNERDNAEYLGYAVAGGVAFDPRNPDRFLVGVSQELNGEDINAFLVTLQAK